MTDADMDKAQVGIASVWYEGNTCNMPAGPCAKVKEGVSDRRRAWSGCSFQHHRRQRRRNIMGTDGMSSLQSRDLIADSIETIMGAQWYDGPLVALPGCDKNMPGCLIAMGSSTARR
ncbi:MAG: dihydroxy-acid dehydratase [Phycisphaerales bacterium]